MHDVHPYGCSTRRASCACRATSARPRSRSASGRERHYDAAARASASARLTGSGFPDESAGLLRPWQAVAPGRPRDDRVRPGHERDADAARDRVRRRSPTAASGARRASWPRAARPTARGSDLPPSAPRRVLRRRRAATVLGMLETVVGARRHRRAAPACATSASPARPAPRRSSTARRDATRAHRYQRWFVGVVPADDPRVVIVVDARRAARLVHTGGTTAAPSSRASPQRARARRHPRRAARARRCPSGRAPTGLPPRKAATRDEPAAPARARGGRRAARRRADAGRAEPPGRAARGAKRRRVGAPNGVRSCDDRVLLPDFRGRTVEEVRGQHCGPRLEVEVVGQRPRRGAGARRPARSCAAAVRVQFAARRRRRRAQEGAMMRLSALLAALPPELAPASRRGGDPAIRGIPTDSRARGAGRPVRRAARRAAPTATPSWRRRVALGAAALRRRGARRAGAPVPPVVRGRRRAPRARADRGALLRRSGRAS